MASPDFVSALARLLADPTARAEWHADPVAYAGRCDCPTLAELDPAQLERQAQGLLGKRWHEVQKLLPTADRQQFLRYAVTHWPEGHDRHREDARMFQRWCGPQA